MLCSHTCVVPCLVVEIPLMELLASILMVATSETIHSVERQDSLKWHASTIQELCGVIFSIP